MNCAHTTDLGAYVLGSLEPADRAAVDEHLLSCPTCPAELADLAGLLTLLAGVNPGPVTSVVPSADLYDRIAAATADPPRHARRRPRLVAVAAAAVIVLAGFGAGLGYAVHTVAPTASASASAGAVHITVTASAENAGTALKVAVEGLPENEHCHLVAVARDGSRHGAGDWVATYAGRAQVTGSTDVPRADLASLVLLGTHGQQLVTVTL